MSEPPPSRAYARFRARRGVAPAVLALSLWCGACAGGTQADAPPVLLDAPLHHEVLDNGMELVVVPDQTVPVVTALVGFRAGARIEDDTRDGHSHLFEHMIFKGSEAVPQPQVFADRLDAAGARHNATTGVDRVTYFVTTQRSQLDEALGLFAGALRRPALLPEELAKEQQVVLAEFDLNESDPEFLLLRRLRQAVFGAQFSRVDPLGSRAAVSAASVQELRSTHARYYVPNNAVLVFSGDITREAARQLAETHFGDWARAADPFEGQAATEWPRLEGDRFEVMAAEVSQATLRVGWRLPGIAEAPAILYEGELLAQVANQIAHPLRSLVGEDRAVGAWLSFWPGVQASELHLRVTLPYGNEEAVFERLPGVLERMGRKDSVTESLLQIAKDQLWSDTFYAQDDPGAVAHWVGDLWALRDVDAARDYAAALYDVSRGDLGRLSRQHLRGGPRVVAFMASQSHLDSLGIDAAWLKERL